MATRTTILDQLARGEIDVERASQLLNDLREGHGAEPVAEPAAPAIPVIPTTPAMPLPPAPQRPPLPAAPRIPQAGTPGRRWLRIHVSDLETGRSRVRVNVPLGLVHFGLKLGARFTDEVDGEMIQNLIAALKDQDMTGTLVEVEDVDDNEHVHIYID